MPDIIDLYVIFIFLLIIVIILALLYGMYLSFGKEFGWGDMLNLIFGLMIIGQFSRLLRWLIENYWY